MAKTPIRRVSRTLPPSVVTPVRMSTDEVHTEDEREDVGHDVEDTEDGGALVTFDDGEQDEEPGESGWYDNLAETASELDLQGIAISLLELIDRDKEARSKRDKQYEEGIRRTGLGDDAPGGASFAGASKVVHPMLAEACVDFAARAMKELWPTGGPVRDRIEGKVTAEKAARAQRKTRLMNWQLTVQCKDFRAELEQLMTQVPLGGAQYLKVSWDTKRNRPIPLFIAIDDLYLPFAATNFYSAQRKTHVQYLTKLDYEQRVRSGMYRDVDIVAAGMVPDQSASGAASDRIEGRDASAYNEDGLRTVYECMVTFDVGGVDTLDEPAPYIISLDKSTQTVLAVYRNWAEGDDSLEELDHIVEWPFVPWRGAYPIGLPHLIGGLSAAATGALRALMDSAHIANMPTMVRLKGSKGGGQNTTIQPTQVAEIDGSFNVDDIRKMAMPLPFNQPSPVLFSLLGFLVDASKGVVRTTLDDAMDTNPNTPVGTTLARFEQGMVVYSAIHGRLHDAMDRMLRILHRNNATYLEDENIVEEAGEDMARREDFEGPMDVVPVSDPNIFSEAQRFGQVQAIAQRADQKPEMYDQRAIELRLLETLKIPDPEKLLSPAMTPSEQNAANENAAASLGRPITAFPAQDHLAHLRTHVAYMMSPTFGLNPLVAPVLIPIMLGHLKEHVALWYVSAIFDLASEALGTDAGEVLKDIAGNEEARKALDGMIAEASIVVLQQGEDVFASLPPVIQEAQQIMQQLSQTQTPPQDPRIAIEQQKVQQHGAYQQGQLQLAAQRLQQEGERSTQALALKAQQVRMAMMTEAQRQEAEAQRQAADLQARMAMNREDNETAMRLSMAEILSGEKTQYSTGTGINPNP